MLKGKTRIELTDVRTGEKQVVEEENMITNALRDQLRFFAPYYGKDELNEYILPLANNAMGGIKLFDAALEENPDNYYLPNVKKAKVVGYASADTTPGDDPMRGSRNLQESKEVENGYQYVWDFATSEANGTIASLGLTTKEGGTKLWYPNTTGATGLLRDEETKGWFADIDVLNGKYFNILWNSSKSTATVKEYSFNYDNLSLMDKVLDPLLIKETLIECPGGKSSTIMRFRDDGSGSWCAVYTDGNSAGSRALVYIYLIQKETLRFELKTIEVPDVVITRSYYNNSIVFDGYVYLTKKVESGKAKGFYKVKIDDVSDVEEIDFDVWKELDYTVVNINPLKNGMMYSAGVIFDGTVMCKFHENGIYYNNSEYNMFLSQSQNGVLAVKTKQVYSTEGMYLTWDKNVLMSINNLSSPVVKTADKTMKIIYTVTYQE